MTVLNSIVPGKVVNHGIRDRSIPVYEPQSPNHPLHLPVISMITPIGPLASEDGTTWINTSDVQAIFGNIFDPKSPFYNPNSVLISALAQAGQASFGLRRLSANAKKARVALSAFVQEVEVQDYERDLSGRFKRDEHGDKIPTGNDAYTGLKIEIKPDPEAATNDVGELVVREIPEIPAGPSGDDGVPATYVYPLFEAIAGVGDLYNNNGLSLGIKDDNSSYKQASEFVRDTGVFPFTLRLFRDNDKGIRSYATTRIGSDATTFTLFKTDYANQTFSVKHGFGEFTGTNVNRPVTPRPSPFSKTHVYEDNIESLCMLMWSKEKEHNPSLVEVGDYHYRQMNPFTCVNHNGAPYYAIEGSDVVMWDLSGSVKATGGISPFLDDGGELPSYVTPHTPYDPMGILANVNFPVTPSQAWECNNALMEVDMKEYVEGTEPKNYTKNRQSFFWDVGFTQEVKDEAIRLLASRKDIVVVPCATVWKPGQRNELAEIYSRFTALANSVRLYPESEKWGTPACRASINLIEAKVIDEETSEHFSGNIDLAYHFAQFAGNQQGIIYPAYSPDSGVNRELALMHSPNIEFEEDDIGGANFDNGGITLRPKDVERLFRPALVTVYNNPDSVLKDLVTTFLCVSIEKIAQDEWNNVCGDTTLSKNNYEALFKDGVERKCRDKLGGLAKNIEVEPSFAEGVVGGRAVMNAIVHASFNKGRYMMNLDLFAYNEQDR